MVSLSKVIFEALKVTFDEKLIGGVSVDLGDLVQNLVAVKHGAVV